MTTATSATEPLAHHVVPSLVPQVDFPEDASLPGLSKLFDAAWIWQLWIETFGSSEAIPVQFRLREFSHRIGRTAVVSYVAEWPPEDYLPPQIFTLRLDRRGAVELKRFPDDPSLPGLAQVVSPEGALGLVNKHVLAIPVRRAHVELVRYRTGSRAVLRHKVGKSRFYARAMRPLAVADMLKSRQLVSNSGFVIPRLAGMWDEGAVMWVSEIPGRNVRHQIRRRRAPDPDRLLDAIEPLWASEFQGKNAGTFNFERAFRRARGSLQHKTRDFEDGETLLKAVSGTLDAFVESWQPSSNAHNDFYDDQMIALRNGKIALVDYEEAGAGDALLDIGNFLAHLRWATRFGPADNAEPCAEYYNALRSTALERFDWQARDLALREATCLFRVCTNAVRHPMPNWTTQLFEGLRLVHETLDE